LGQALGVPDLVDGVPAHAGARAQDNHGGEQAGHGLGLAMAVGMVGVGRPGGPLEPRPDQDRYRDVAEGLDAIGHQGVGIAENAAADLDHSEHHVQDHAAHDEARALLGPVHDACLVCGNLHCGATLGCPGENLNTSPLTLRGTAP